MNPVQLFRKSMVTALEHQTKRLLKRHPIKVVAVTGSFGKTSTKLAAAAVLSQRYRVLAHAGNYNTEFGLPLSLFERSAPRNLRSPFAWARLLASVARQVNQPYPYDVVVLEMGADQPGDIKRFMGYITPDIGIVTAVSGVHLERFGSVAAIAREKLVLATSSRQAVVNLDNDIIRESPELAELPDAVTYGLERGVVRGTDIKRRADGGLTTEVRIGKDKRVLVKSQVVGEHGLYALVAAMAVGELMGVKPAEGAKALEALAPTAGRMQPLIGRDDALILDDSYNASPDATIAALQVLSQFKGRKIAILGTMNELGEFSQEGHAAVGAVCGELDLLVTIGESANSWLADAAEAAGLNKRSIKRCKSPYEAGKYVAKRLKDGDTVLVKGSQNGVFSEEAVALLLNNPADRSKLVRQGDNWLATKRQQFEDAL